ncbi:claudin j [Tachysurus vachellii]|uniref:claudin j n=1 Tax=Tachysurus vachellii TaxID=175792 RepID=UPI00296B029A|nr:claudin j [Tachysurus vachellii]
MASAGLQMLGCTLALIGYIGVIIICALPMWRVTAFIGNNIVTSQIFWEGIWMTCVVQSTGQMQCKVYDSMLALTSDLQAARAMVVVALVVGLAGIFMAFAAGKCTNFISEGNGKSRASIAAGVVLIIAGVLTFIPVSWTANSITRDFYNPLLVDAQKRELGASLYIGWGVLGITLSMIGLAGTIIICALPMWKVTAFVGTNIVVAQVFWEGLWMTCVYEHTGQMQCKLYDALLDLDPTLQASRGLMVTTMALACLGFLIFLLGAECTNCLSNPRAKARIVVASGITFMLSGLGTAIPVSWTADTIIRDFHNPVVHEALKREMGAAIYVGWVTAGFLFIGGAILCTSCPPERVKHFSRYTATKSGPQSSYAFKNYV